MGSEKGQHLFSCLCHSCQGWLVHKNVHSMNDSALLVINLLKCMTYGIEQSQAVAFIPSVQKGHIA